MENVKQDSQNNTKCILRQSQDKKLKVNYWEKGCLFLNPNVFFVLDAAKNKVQSFLVACKHKNLNHNIEKILTVSSKEQAQTEVLNTSWMLWTLCIDSTKLMDKVWGVIMT